VTDDLDQQVRQALQRRRRSPRVFLSICVLAAVAGTSGYLWLNYDRLAKLAFAERSSVAPAADTGVAQKDFEALKRQTAESLQSTIEDIAAQKAELKRLSDQVSALASEVSMFLLRAESTGIVVRGGSIPPLLTLLAW
jgi:hypothetical protein